MSLSSYLASFWILTNAWHNSILDISGVCGHQIQFTRKILSDVKEDETLAYSYPRVAEYGSLRALNHSNGCFIDLLSNEQDENFPSMYVRKQQLDFCSLRLELGVAPRPARYLL